MIYYAVKIAVSAALLLGASELAKRSSFIGGLIVSLPLVSVLAIGWLYAETRDSQKVAALSWSIFWLVLPSLSFFAAFAMLLRRNWPFGVSLVSALAIMLASYAAMLLVLKRCGVHL
ncbi:MAG TPA: DUF3147 family protein [Candidatus Binatia bacterium]|nr:DUF3147 family protein [Candidatus Binatia bacterium]